MPLDIALLLRALALGRVLAFAIAASKAPARSRQALLPLLL